MYEVITVGSGTVDVFVDTAQKELRSHKHHEDVCYHVGGKQLVKGLTISTGGGGTNAACCCARLGMKTGWLGVVGDDLHGQHILSDCKREKIRFLGKSVKGQSGYSVILTGLHRDRTILAYKGVNNMLSGVTISSLKPDWFYFSSMMGKSFETAKKIVSHAKRKKINYVFNPSPYLARKKISGLKSFVKGCMLLVCNREEANLLCGTKGKQSAQLMSKLFRAGARNVVITDGARGAVGCDGKNLYVLKADKSKVVDTTGAGDAFACTTMAFLDKGLGKAMALGYAQATSVIGHVGAKKGLLSKTALHSRVKKQKITVSKKKAKL